jgi:hypothetical protein
MQKPGTIDSLGDFVYATLPVLGEIHMLTAVRQ